MSDPPQPPRESPSLSLSSSPANIPPPSAAASERLSSQPSSGSLRRDVPPSPRTSSRHPSISLSSSAIADLLSSPPPPQGTKEMPKDWRSIKISELLHEQKLRFVYQDTTVESACHTLIEHNISSVPVLASANDETVVGTFDYSDLNAFLLLMVGLYNPEEADPESGEILSSFNDLAAKARTGSSIPVKLVKDLSKKDPFVTLEEDETLGKAVELLGGGVHRIAVTRAGAEAKGKVVGILSQLAVVKWFWEHARYYPSVETLLAANLRDLNIGSPNVISIHGDRKVSDALTLMNTESISSLAVIDSHSNVVGNISVADVKYLTRASSIPLLRTSCLQFLGIILNDRGLNDGKDSYPVFHVTRLSTLSHTIAKLVATRSHRMWLVEPPSPNNSNPPTPSLTHASPVGSAPNTTIPYASPSSPSPLSAASAAASARITSGSLIGVVSLTDILNVIARSAGLMPVDPGQARRERRRSSSASQRTSVEFSRGLGDLRR
ncbi:hypothetical protein BJ508DRAFT_418050 [Ascobolus immersus RN42]|uniref:CBS domain-containing protein n=1 Tax=Ascobolus immersus RN42 TaxID=1160509 RepID=A0A3N4HST6_ASCIM|nr:hypothetical protein BJ508DRAFT_418050 [Ascobolus immersus RN42]